MSFKAEIIDLFGEKLILHERTIGDEFRHRDKMLSIIDYDETHELLLNCQMLLDGLSLNIKDCYLLIGDIKILTKPFRKRKLSKLLSIKNLFENLRIGELNRLLNKLNIDLEGLEKGTGDNKVVISRANMISLVCEFTNCKWEDVLNLPITEFRERLEQAMKIAAIYGGGKYDPLSEKDKQDNLDREFAEIDWSKYAGRN